MGIKKAINLSIIVILIVPVLSFGGLDLSSYSPETVTNKIKPVISFLAQRQQIPLGHLLYEPRPGAVITAQASTGANLSEFWGGAPGLWSSIAVSKNLLLTATLNNSGIGNDNATSFGSGFTTSWGEDSTKNYFSLGINYLRGPDDFYSQNIHISLQKRIIFRGWQIMGGLTRHFNRLSINVADNPNSEDNYKDTKRIELTHLRAGIYKREPNFSYGLEGTVSCHMLGISVNITAYLP